MMMKNFDESVKINHNLNWPYIPDNPYRVLTIGVSGSGKTNELLNLIKHQQPDVDKIYFYIKHQFESQYRLLINEREKVGIKHEEIQKLLLIIHKQCELILEYYNTTKKRKVLLVFDYMTANLKANKKLKPIVVEWLMRARQLNISVVFHILILFRSP